MVASGTCARNSVSMIAHAAKEARKMAWQREASRRRGSTPPGIGRHLNGGGFSAAPLSRGGSIAHHFSAWRSSSPSRINNRSVSAVARQAVLCQREKPPLTNLPRHGEASACRSSPSTVAIFLRARRGSFASSIIIGLARLAQRAPARARRNAARAHAARRCAAPSSGTAFIPIGNARRRRGMSPLKRQSAASSPSQKSSCARAIIKSAGDLRRRKPSCTATNTRHDSAA